MAREKKARPLITFVVDSREQEPYSFTIPVRREFEDGGFYVTGLKEGDYSVCIDGSEPLPVRIERKSIGDFYGVVGFGRERFEAELVRLVQYDKAVLLIEATAEQVLAGFERSQISGKAALASAICWMTRQSNLSTVFAGNRTLGRAITQRILEEFALHHLQRLTIS